MGGKCGIAGLMVLMMMMMILCSRIGGVTAAVYTVGESSGWSTGGDYSSWATDKKFTVGDTLAFNYAPGHTVDEVTANDYKTCTTGNAIASDSSGATSVTLKTAGPHYYICGVPGHCGGGMKLAVTVAAAASGGGGGGGGASPSGTTTSPPSTTTSPVPPTSVTSPTGTGGTLTHPAASSSAALSPAVAAFLSFCFVMFKCFLL